MDQLPSLGISEVDMKDIWATLDAAGRGKCRKSDIVSALKNPEMQALLTLTSKYGATAAGEAAVSILAQNPERTVWLIKQFDPTEEEGAKGSLKHTEVITIAWTLVVHSVSSTPNAERESPERERTAGRGKTRRKRLAMWCCHSVALSPSVSLSPFR
jgi:hypothetical protein